MNLNKTFVAVQDASRNMLASVSYTHLDVYKRQGRGIQKLKDAGREVIVGVLETECRQLIRRFITFHTSRRPYITLKWAESSDRYILPVNDFP